MKMIKLSHHDTNINNSIRKNHHPIDLVNFDPLTDQLDIAMIELHFLNENTKQYEFM